MFRAAAVAVALTAPLPALSDAPQVIADRDAFVSLVEDRELKRFGITLRVSPSGAIEGSAFGTPVTGAWRWQDGYFCRDLYYGSRDLGPNCQLVELRAGQTLRFIADQGRGQYADLRLD